MSPFVFVFGLYKRASEMFNSSNEVSDFLKSTLAEMKCTDRYLIFLILYQYSSSVTLKKLSTYAYNPKCQGVPLTNTYIED